MCVAGSGGGELPEIAQPHPCGLFRQLPLHDAISTYRFRCKLRYDAPTTPPPCMRLCLAIRARFAAQKRSTPQRFRPLRGMLWRADEAGPMLLDDPQPKSPGGCPRVEDGSA